MDEKSLTFTQMTFAQKADYVRRFFGTMGGFIFFGVAGWLFALVLLPDILRGKKQTLKHQMRARHKNAAVWRALLRYLRFAGVLDYRLQGFGRLGRSGQVVFCNHPSLLDVLFLAGHAPQINCIVKKDLLKNPLMFAPITACGYLPNDESVEMLMRAGEILKDQSLLIFPEGTRTGWDGRIHLNRAAVSVGLRSAQIITPVFVRMDPPNFKKHQPWYKIPRRKIVYDIRVGDDIDPQDWLREKPLPIATRRLTAHLQEMFQAAGTENT